MASIRVQRSWDQEIDSSRDWLDFPVVKLTWDAQNGPYADRPDLLFVCGVHPQERMAQEVCLGLIESLVKRAFEYQNLLQTTEIWVVPFGSPGGRKLDDLDGDGNPRVFYGQRRNVQTSPSYVEDFSQVPPFGGACAMSNANDEESLDYPGVNIARNFSVDWDFVPSGDKDNDARKVPELVNCDPTNNKCPSDHPEWIGTSLSTSIPTSPAPRTTTLTGPSPTTRRVRALP